MVKSLFHLRSSSSGAPMPSISPSEKLTWTRPPALTKQETQSLPFLGVKPLATWRHVLTLRSTMVTASVATFHPNPFPDALTLCDIPLG